MKMFRNLIILLTFYSVTAFWPMAENPIIPPQSNTPISDLAKFLIQSLPSLSTKNQCGSALFNLFTKDIGNARSLSMIMASGKKINDVGDYLACYKTPGMRYVLTGFTSGGDFLWLRLGVCYPEECTVEALYEYRDAIAGFFSTLAKMPVNPKTVKLVETKAQNEELSSNYFATTLFYLITGFLITLAILGTIFDELGLYGSEKEPTNDNMMKVLQSFSLSRNLKSFFKAANPVDPNLEIFNGVRFVCMAWIIIGHTYENEFGTPTYNLWIFYQKIINGYWYSFIKSGTLAVDAFFMLSGFFAAMSFFSIFKKEETRNFKTFLLSYLYRYLRLFPMMFFTFMIIMYVIPTIKDQPVDLAIKNEIANCENSWYWTFLYVNNFQKFQETCIDWSWYLMNDMQFYILAPFLILPFLKSKKLGFLVLGVVCSISLVVTACIYNHYEFHASLAKPNWNDYYSIYYVRPYCRIPVYLIGIAFYVLYKESKSPAEEQSPILKKCNSFIGNFGKYLFYLCGLVIMFYCVIAIYYFDSAPYDFSQGLATFHELAFRPGFIIGLCMILYPTLINQGPFLNSIFGHPIFNPLSKITYGVYMLHIPIMLVLFRYTLGGHYMTDTWVWANFFTLIAATYLISFVSSIIYESPVIVLIKTFLERGGNAKKLLPNKNETQGEKSSLLKENENSKINS